MQHPSKDDRFPIVSKGSLEMNTTEIRELTDSDLDLVSGGGNVAGYKYCAIGSKAGGGEGLYPSNVSCSEGQMTDLANLVLQTAANGRIILGGGSPA
jgi:hypothetical protein